MARLMQKQFREPHVNRGTTCLDAGVYLPNFVQCAKCGSDLPPVASPPRVTEEDDDDELVEETEYDHRCASCGAVLAVHWHKFASGPDGRRWIMECVLCGSLRCDTSSTRVEGSVLAQAAAPTSARRWPRT